MVAMDLSVLERDIARQGCIWFLPTCSCGSATWLWAQRLQMKFLVLLIFDLEYIHFMEGTSGSLLCFHFYRFLQNLWLFWYTLKSVLKHPCQENENILTSGFGKNPHIVQLYLYVWWLQNFHSHFVILPTKPGGTESVHSYMTPILLMASPRRWEVSRVNAGRRCEAKRGFPCLGIVLRRPSPSFYFCFSFAFVHPFPIGWWWSSCWKPQGVIKRN